MNYWKFEIYFSNLKMKFKKYIDLSLELIIKHLKFIFLNLKIKLNERIILKELINCLELLVTTATFTEITEIYNYQK